MITKSQCATLLARAASSDQRTIGETDAGAWFEAGSMERWTFPVARRIVAEYYSSGAGKPRITEAHISDRVRVLRSAAAASFTEPPIPEGQLTRDYPAWHRTLLAAHIDEALTRWVRTGIEPGSDTSAPRPAIDHDGLARVHQLIGGAFAALASDDAEDPEDLRRRDALQHPCSFCQAKPGEPCTRTSVGRKRIKLRKVHPARAEAAEAA